MANARLTETLLLDAYRSFSSQNFNNSQMVPVLDELDKVGYESVQVLDSSVFEECIDTLQEDPWERLRHIRTRMPNTKLLATVAGRCLLGFKPFSNDVVEYFIQRCVANGIDIFRIFDPLNQIDNLKAAILAAKKENCHVQGTICYVESPVHKTEVYVNLASQLAELKVDSICIMDFAGIVSPYALYDLVKVIKAVVNLPIQVHSRACTSQASMSYIKAIEAGADMFDTAATPFSDQTSLPSTQAVIKALANSPYDSRLESKSFINMESYLFALRHNSKYSNFGSLQILSACNNAYLHQLSADMIVSLAKELYRIDKSDMLSAVLEEVATIRRDAGYPALVGPIAHIVGTQALVNTLSGERYSTVSKEFKSFVAGAYGEVPAAIDVAFRQAVLGENVPEQALPQDLQTLKAGLPEKYNEQPEDVLTLALFPETAARYLEQRSNRKYGIDDRYANEKGQSHPV